MKPEHEALDKQRRDYEGKAHALKSFVKELTETATKCGTDSALLEEDLLKAQTDAEFYEGQLARLGELLAADAHDLTFSVQKDAAGEWRWNLRARNKRIIADSGEGYQHRQDCLHAIELVKASANAPIEEGA